jgi:predicted ester cyclase
MSAEQNRQLTERIIEEPFNRGNTATAGDFIHPEFVDHSPPPVPDFPTVGVASVLAAVAMFRGAFPDVHFTTDELIAEGDTVVQHYTMRGTSEGPLMGMRPTGRPVTMTGINILRFRDGKCVEHRNEVDGLGLMRQLGATPTRGLFGGAIVCCRVLGSRGVTGSNACGAA